MSEQKIPEIFSTHTAARVCRVTPMTIIRWIKDGHIRAHKTQGGHRRIMRADLEDFCVKNQIPLSWIEQPGDTTTQRALIIDTNSADRDAIYDALVDRAETDEERCFSVYETDNLFDGGRLMAKYLPHFIILALDVPGLNFDKWIESAHSAVIPQLRSNAPQDLPHEPSLRSFHAAPTPRILGILSADTKLTEEQLSKLDGTLTRQAIEPTVVRQLTGPMPKV